MTGTTPRVLGGRYELGGLLGVGGMAQVLEAHDARLGRAVAVKVLRPELARDPAFHDRFRREAQAAASLTDPSVVAVYDTGEDEQGAPYIVMERVEGQTLREVLQREGRLPAQRALAVVADVCGALQVAHAAGIVHRDVKPGNVMLTPSGEVKVMDFGIARAVADSSATMTQTAAVIGTAAYLSPEQARGEQVDARSDLYSTGCLLFELLTGTPPFSGDSAVAVAYQHVREEPVPPTAYDASLAPEVDAVVLKAMRKDPAQRYQTAREMRDDLLRAAAGRRVEAPPAVVETAPVRVQRAAPSRARRGLVRGLFGLVLLGVALSVALLVRGLLGNDTGVVEAPSLVGLTQQRAVQELAERGLRAGRIDASFAERPAGTVVRQDPQEGFVVPPGGSVNLVVSRGIDLTAVPAVVGQTREEAVGTLERARLGVAEVRTADGDVPKGQVLEVQPPTGRRLRPGTEVVLVVASGRVGVPDVRGRSQDEAVQVLRRAGLSVGVRPIESFQEPGTVIEQDPVGGALERGEAVVIGVTRRPPPRPTPTPLPAAPPAPAATLPPPGPAVPEDTPATPLGE